MKNDYGSFMADQEAEFQRLRREKEDRAIAWFFGTIAVGIIAGRVLGWW